MTTTDHGRFRLPARLPLAAVLLGTAWAVSGCGGGGGGGSAGGGVVTPPLTAVTISGRVSYERVPFSTTSGRGLDYARTVEKPARGIVVELLRDDQSLLATTTTSANGDYAFSNVTASINVIVRAKAQLLATGSPSWNIQIKNNANSNALYVMDTAVFNSGTANVTRNLLADSGWPSGGSSYTTTRVAAPFAILDTLYSAVQRVTGQGDATLVLAPLEVFWSTQNKSSELWNPAVGNIQTTLFRPVEEAGFPPGIYVLGDQNVDTDEYDAHVIAHEFHHFLQNSLSRDDTLGGSHSFSEKLDLRVAFSEGMANAFSGMVLDDPAYRDSFGASQGSDFGNNLENNPAQGSDQVGWFNERSVGSILWDLYDSAADSGDTVSLGYGPIFTAMKSIGGGVAVTSIFPFIVALKSAAPAANAGIDALVTNQSIAASNMDAYATSETNDGGTADVLPMYTTLLPNVPVTVCGNTTAGTENKIGNRRLLRLSVDSPRSFTLTATYTANGSSTATGGTPDPDLLVYQGALVAAGESGDPNVETVIRTLNAGDYVLEVFEYSHVDPATTVIRRGRTCMVVTASG